MNEIKAYACDYCNKYYKHKSSARRHETRCFKNPQNKACLTCGNFKTDYKDVKYNYCDYTGRSFQDYDGNRQKFQHNCKHWKPTGLRC